MNKLDITTARSFTLLLAPNADFDQPYTFYYDETNNVKKFLFKNGTFNVAFSSNFILGGLVYEGQKPDVSDIFNGIPLQPNVTEVKLTHLAKNDFIACLGSIKLTPFLKHLVASRLYLHYSSLNLLYYSLVDIVDSAIAGAGDQIEIMPGTARKLKNDLYRLCRLEIDQVIPLFIKYGYPNIQPSALTNFVTELMSLFKSYARHPELEVGLMMLQDLLDEALKNGSLPFIVDETSLLMIGGLVQFYQRPIYLFLNSMHIFDNETEIQVQIEEIELVNNGNPVRNYSFLDSKSDLLTQASDVIIGFIGKLSKFINTHTHDEIKGQIQSLSAVQALNLDLFLDLIIKSEKKNPVFFHNIDSDDDLSKLSYIARLRGKRL